MAVDALVGVARDEQIVGCRRDGGADQARRGIRHRLVTVLALAVCAVLAGARSYVAIAEWAHDLPLGVRVRLGLTVGRATPSESAIRRILQKIDRKRWTGWCRAGWSPAPPAPARRPQTRRSPARRSPARRS